MQKVPDDETTGQVTDSLRSQRADARAPGRPMGLVGRVLAVDRIFFSRGLCAGFGESERQVLSAGEEERGKLCGGSTRHYPGGSHSLTSGSYIPEVVS